MHQLGPSSRTIAPQLNDSPESPGSPDNRIDDIPQVAVEILLRSGLESSSEDEYLEPSSEEENNKVHHKVVPPVDYGYDDDYIGDANFTLYTRREVHLLKGWRAFVLERRSCGGFLVPEPPIPERRKLVFRAINGVNWHRAVLVGSGEAMIEMLSAAVTGLSITSPKKRQE